MKENKVAFITCINNDDLYQKSLSYINKLRVPEGMEIEIIEIRDAKSLASGYNAAIQKSDSKYKVYLHQDVYIQNTNFIGDILNIFKNDLTIGMIGMVGCKVIPPSGEWWKEYGWVGKVYDSQPGFMSLTAGWTFVGNYAEVKAVDGLIMITQYDLPWREDIFDGWHFYDISQCVEFTKKGLKIVVPNQENAWCLHDCGHVDQTNYDKYRTIFVDNYAKDIFP